MEILLPIAILTLVFYILIPVVGALLVRRRWRVFRESLLKCSYFPLVGYSDVRGILAAGGCFRFFGFLEAIEGSESIWLGDGRLSVCVEMSGVEVFVLSQEANQPPQRIGWKHLGTLPERSRFFVAGKLLHEEGRSLFKNDREIPLIVLLYEGADETVLARAITSGRQKNEYWNFLTPVSLAVGFVSLLFVAYITIRLPQYRSAGILSLALALVPNTFFVPPGIMFFYFYNYFWNRGREHRAKRDLVALPFRWFKSWERLGSGEEWARLPDGETYRCVEADRQDFHVAPGARAFPPDGSPTAIPFAFGTWKEELKTLARPADPMADFVIYPDHPFRLYQENKKKAWTGEILASFLFGAGVLSNLALLVFLLQLWIR